MSQQQKTRRTKHHQRQLQQKPHTRSCAWTQAHSLAEVNLQTETCAMGSPTVARVGEESAEPLPADRASAAGNLNDIWKLNTVQAYYCTVTSSSQVEEAKDDQQPSLDQQKPTHTNKYCTCCLTEEATWEQWSVSNTSSCSISRKGSLDDFEQSQTT